ncbi:cytochrome d ubiquinol oxidase subunit II [Allonocardiopsis opalescens]|uniref:Cytochrome bd-I ubiquinol oxidase subunit 2 apoprotein n=1 Tax=Allonocardiopsis opalescens TaxID=1144618 RepID=A0A2T0PWB2_9ACTN|nr:cytochrome d ubiquinol oxidase subunit II [Allonocardiopsis opalescens]PRX95648.1 cytochrome bd-I ubiquinol oxidase subunit 2 apoprotein [Allonocardiopsis opalescens]
MELDLPLIWFALIAVMWTGYFVLEGFDFGVGVLLPVLGRHPDDRRVMLTAIGPVWDGNEVWLILAVGATFAAFPPWYASLLSGFVLPLLAVIVALILRGAALEYRGKRDDARWRARWDLAITAGSAVPAVMWGLIFATVVRGVPMDADGVVSLGLAELLHPHSLLGGLATLALFTLHGAVFISLKTDGAIRARARATALATAAVAVPATAAFAVWTAYGQGWPLAAALCAAGLATLGTGAIAVGREGWAFTATAAAIALTTATVFGALFPAVLPSSTDPAFSLTIANAASAPYTLTLLSWVALAFTPIVLAYQGWTYWVFRRRLIRTDVTAPSEALTRY